MDQTVGRVFVGSRTRQVIDAIKALHKKRKTDSGKRVLLYYEDNINRMDYQYYKTIGKGIIGSGAIESAHRTLVQSKMKRSGGCNDWRILYFEIFADKISALKREK